MNVSVEEITDSSSEVLDALNGLLPQLSSSAAPLTPAALAEIVESDACHLFVARDGGGSVVGSLTLVAFRIPTGVRAWIEDVVVDESHRGAHVGEALVDAALSMALSLGARTVDLTSRPSREAAHRLYLRCGFATRDTAVYRWSGPDGSDGPA